MTRTISLGLIALLLLKIPAAAQGDGSNSEANAALFRSLAARLSTARKRIEEARAKTPDRVQGLIDNIAVTIDDFAPFLVGAHELRQAFLSDIEDDRLNKQIGTAANAAGSTSVVSKGSVPGLFGFAVENGALTREISGTTVTFRTSPANLYAALKRQGYLPAGPAIPPLDGSFESLAKRASFYVGFDTSRGNMQAGSTTVDDGNTPGESGSTNPLVLRADRQQLAAFGFRYDLYNKRDPRRPEYLAGFNQLLVTEGLPYLRAITQLVVALRSFPAYIAWRDKLTGTIVDASAEADLTGSLAAGVPGFNVVLNDFLVAQPEQQLQVQNTVTAARRFFSARNNLINSITRSWTAAVEYNFVAQGNTGATLTTPAGMSVDLPDLGNLNFVASKGFIDGPEFTFNAGLTWFQGVPAGLQTGTIRDIRASAQLDFPLRRIENIGTPVLAFASQFMSLRSEALGQKVVINGVELTTKGNIGLIQAKLTVPTKGGVSFPFSVTWANRTELIKEKEVRANIGVTFDFDKLFAKP
jgi:hypothetical protein